MTLPTDTFTEEGLDEALLAEELEVLRPWGSLNPQFLPPALLHDTASIDERFAAFHRANPWVYEALVRLAHDMRRRGHTKIGMKMLFEVLRWQYARVTAGDGQFRLNNNYTSRYARLIERNEPDLAGMFATRTLRSVDAD